MAGFLNKAKECSSDFHEFLAFKQMGTTEIAARAPRIREPHVKEFGSAYRHRACGSSLDPTHKSNKNNYDLCSITLTSDPLLNSYYLSLQLTSNATTKREDIAIDFLIDEDAINYYLTPNGYLFIYTKSNSTLNVFDIYNRQKDENLKPINTLIAKKSLTAVGPKVNKVLDFPGLKLKSPDPEIVAFVKPTPPKSTAQKALRLALGLIGVAGAALALYSLAPVTFTAAVLSLKSAATSTILKSIATRIGFIALGGLTGVLNSIFIASGETRAEGDFRFQVAILANIGFTGAVIAAYYTSPVAFTAAVIALSAKLTIAGYGIMAAGALAGAGVLGHKIWRAL